MGYTVSLLSKVESRWLCSHISFRIVTMFREPLRKWSWGHSNVFTVWEVWTITLYTSSVVYTVVGAAINWRHNTMLVASDQAFYLRTVIHFPSIFGFKFLWRGSGLSPEAVAATTGAGTEGPPSSVAMVPSTPTMSNSRWRRKNHNPSNRWCSKTNLEIRFTH